MQDQSRSWETLDRNERLLVVLRLIEKTDNAIGCAEKTSKKRDICHLGQHPQAMYWLLRDGIYDPYIESNKYADCTRRTEKSGDIIRRKLQDTLVNEKIESQFGSLNSKIPFLTDQGRDRADQLLSEIEETVNLPPDWFLYLCLAGVVEPPYDNPENYPLPVVIHDLKPEVTGMHHGAWSQIADDKPIRSRFPHHNILNYSHRQLIRLLREEKGIHLLQGGAGSGKTSMVESATGYWPKAHLIDSNTFELQVTVSCLDLATYIHEKTEPPEDDEEAEKWFAEREKEEIPYPDSAEEEDWELFEQARREKNKEYILKLIDEFIFSRYTQRLPSTTPKETLIEMLRKNNPRIVLIVDGLDEVSLHYRNLLLRDLNRWSLIYPNHSILISSRPMVTGNQYLPNLETVIELNDLGQNWPMQVEPEELRPSEDLRIETWPSGLARTPLTWMLIRSTQDKTSKNADEYEILEQYLDDSMGNALLKGQPPIPKREILRHLRRAALHHSTRKLTEICELSLLDGENEDDVRRDLGESCQWAKHRMQIMQETHGWRLRGFDEVLVDEGSLRFTHRRIQEYLASQSFSNIDEFKQWINLGVIQNPEWCWPIIRDVCHRLNNREEIIELIQKFDEDILGHNTGLVAYLNGDNPRLLPSAIPEPPQLMGSDGTIHHDNTTRQAINSSRQNEFVKRGDYHWDQGQAVFGRPQDTSENAKKKSALILQTLREHEVEEGHVLDWVGTFGLDTSICQCLANTLLESDNQLWFSEHGSNYERVNPFLQYLLSLFWEAKRPEDFTVDDWHSMYNNVRKVSLEESLQQNDTILNIYILKKNTQPPFKHPSSQLIGFFSENVSFSWAIELCWMFDIPVTGDIFNTWVRSLPDANYSEPYFGWIDIILKDIRTGMILGQSKNRIRHPRIRDQRIHHSNSEIGPTKASEVLAILESDEFHMMKLIKLSASVSQWELKELLQAADEEGKMDILQDYLSSTPLMHTPKKILEETKSELEDLGHDVDPVLKQMLGNHTEENNFLNYWCHAPYESGEVPLLKDFPWFEELWG